MTSTEELTYLTDLLLQSSRWNRDPDEVLSGVELEVQDRVRRLTGRNTIDENGYCQSVVERGLEKKKAKTERKMAKEKNRHIGQHRIMVDGHKRWVDESLLEKEPWASPTGYRWKIKEVDDEKENT